MTMKFTKGTTADCDITFLLATEDVTSGDKVYKQLLSFLNKIPAQNAEKVFSAFMKASYDDVDIDTGGDGTVVKFTAYGSQMRLDFMRV